MQPNARPVARQERVLTSLGSHALESRRREHGAKTKSENILTVKKLAKSFEKVKAVRGVSFEVKKGEICGLLRPNGAVPFAPLSYNFQYRLMWLLDQVLCLDGPLLSLTGKASGVEDALLKPLGTVHDPTPCQEGRTAYFPPALHDAGQEEDDD